jgi:hypothetical protein
VNHGKIFSLAQEGGIIIDWGPVLGDALLGIESMFILWDCMLSREIRFHYLFCTQLRAFVNNGHSVEGDKAVSFESILAFGCGCGVIVGRCGLKGGH